MSAIIEPTGNAGATAKEAKAAVKKAKTYKVVYDVVITSNGSFPAGAIVPADRFSEKDASDFWGMGAIVVHEEA